MPNKNAHNWRTKRTIGVNFRCSQIKASKNNTKNFNLRIWQVKYKPKNTPLITQNNAINVEVAAIAASGHCGGCRWRPALNLCRTRTNAEYQCWPTRLKMNKNCVVACKKPKINLWMLPFSVASSIKVCCVDQLWMRIYSGNCKSLQCTWWSVGGAGMLQGFVAPNSHKNAWAHIKRILDGLLFLW